MRNFLCICLFIVLASCQSTNEGQKEQPLTVRLFKAEPLTNESKREFSFISKPFKSVDLSFRVGGPIAVLDVYPGNFYRKGEVIAAIDSRDYKIRREKAEAVYQQAAAEYKRIAVLYEKDNLPGSSYEKAKSELAIAKAAYESAVNDLNDTQLKAPFDGYVQMVKMERYQDVRPSQAVVSFIDLDQLKIEAYIPEALAAKAQAVQSVNLRFDAIPEKEFSASVLDVSKSTTTNNLSFLLTATLNNQKKENNLLGGMSGTLSLVLSEKEFTDAVVVPQTAVCNRPSIGTYVWVMDAADNKVKSVPVVTGKLKNKHQIELLSGVATGEWIVLTGHSFLSDGMIVTPQK